MDIFPAVDLSGGRVVRLYQGDYEKMTVYDGTPLDAALAFMEAGAKNLHLVDLDGAKDGRPVNRAAIRQIAERTDLFIEVGGGIREENRIADCLALGVGRVILGTVAARNPAFVREMVQKYGEAIAVGVDARDGLVAVSGWLDTTSLDAFAFCVRMRDMGVSTVIYTDIARDGALLGPNLSAYKRLLTIPGLRVTASGGVGSLSDVTALKRTGVHAAIIGKALYEGKVRLSDALTEAEREGI